MCIVHSEFFSSILLLFSLLPTPFSPFSLLPTPFSPSSLLSLLPSLPTPFSPYSLLSLLPSLLLPSLPTPFSPSSLIFPSSLSPQDVVKMRGRTTPTSIRKTLSSPPATSCEPIRGEDRRGTSPAHLAPGSPHTGMCMCTHIVR